jgi:hypothetical protein
MSWETSTSWVTVWRIEYKISQLSCGPPTSRFPIKCPPATRCGAMGFEAVCGFCAAVARWLLPLRLRVAEAPCAAPWRSSAIYDSCRESLRGSHHLRVPTRSGRRCRSGRRVPRRDRGVCDASLLLVPPRVFVTRRLRIARHRTARAGSGGSTSRLLDPWTAPAHSSRRFPQPSAQPGKATPSKVLAGSSRISPPPRMAQAAR